MEILWRNVLLRVGFITVAFMIDLNLADEKNSHSWKIKAKHRNYIYILYMFLSLF